MSGSTNGIDTRAERDRARIDVQILLEYLGQKADSRLQAHFKDTRPQLATPAPKLAVPPCDNYRDFLSRLVAIVARDNSASVQQSPDAKETLDDDAFLYFSRDFLAAVAAPATVDSILVTQAYIYARRHSLAWRFRHFLGRVWRRLRCGPEGPPKPEERIAREHTTDSANRLAFRVACVEYGALVLTLATLIVSAYAYTGHIILTREQQIIADYQALGRERGALLREIKDVHIPSELVRDPLIAPPGCDRAQAQSNAREPQVDGLIHPIAQVNTATTEGEVTAAYIRLCPLYWKIKLANQDIAGATLHLVSWTLVGLNWPIVQKWFGIELSDVFGVHVEYIRQAAEDHDEFCAYNGFATDPKGHCVTALVDVVYRTVEVANSLLACIAHYMLPALYGCLGACAAAMRALRRRVDQSLVTMTDRGRIFQDLILGLLCGAIVGLFAGELGKNSAADGLGLWALALLAGYNVSGMFSFLDTLSKRVFG